MKPFDETSNRSSPARSSLVEKLRGVLLPFPTPFTPDGNLNLRALRANLGRWNRMGVNGYVALGSTGERVHLEEDEIVKVIEVARASVPESMAFIVGAGQQSTRATINDVRRAATLGADAVLVITPHFYRPAITHDALLRHFIAVADAAPVPVLLYSMPDLTGVAIAPETAAYLGRHHNIIGIKDSSADIVNLAETIRFVPEHFQVLTGNGALLYAALSAGARGAILAVGCVAAREAVAVYRAVVAGDFATARELQRKLTPLARAVTARYGIGGLKAALNMLGFEGGAVREPLRAPNEEAQREIGRLLAEAEVFGEAAQDEAAGAKVENKTERASGDYKQYRTGAWME